MQVLTALSVLVAASNALRLTVVHTNDMHSRIDETNAQSSKCVSDSAKCYGGFARVKTAVDDVRRRSTQEGRSTIFLNAGDTYQGTAFYTLLKWKAFVPLIDKLGIDVMSLGNHEFDDGPTGLAPYLKNISTPVVACNLDFSAESTMQNTGITPSKILKVDGVDIGVIGYLTPETVYLSSTGKVKFVDEVTAIREEAKKLTAQGVQIIIAVGHSGYDVDQKIAREVPEVDLVVGGHTNTFLYSGTPPDIETIDGPYPTVVQQSSGKKVPVVQAYAYTKYLGVIHLDINDSGDVTSWEGNPILLNSKISQDPNIQNIVNELKTGIQGRMSESVGLTKVLLEGGTVCRIRECNLANLIADAMVDYNTKMYVGPGWTNAAVALVNAGSVRASITLDDKGIIKYEDLITTMPFENTLERVTLKGNHLLAALENSVARYSPENVPGAFLQFSGMKVVYDMSKPANSRVQSAEIRCANCSVPIYEPLNESMTYTVLMTTYVADGGDGFTVVTENALARKIIGDSDSQVMQDYIQKNSPVYPEVSGRVKVLNIIPPGTKSSGPSIHHLHLSLVVIPIILSYI